MAFIAAAHVKLLNALRFLAGVVIFGVFLLIVTDVLIRLSGFKPWTYSSGIVEYGLLWFTMLAAPWLARAKGHVFIDAVTQLLPPLAQLIVSKIVYFVCVCSSLLVCYFSLDLLIDAIVSNQIDTRGEDMPMWTLLVPIPICFFLVAIEFTRYLLGFDSMYGDRTDVREGV